MTGDTLVATADGPARIEDLVGKAAFVIGGDGKPHFVNHIFPTGTKPVYRLRTKAGYELSSRPIIRCGPRIAATFAALELQTGDRIALGGSGFGRVSLDQRIAFGIGAALGDGCIGHLARAGLHDARRRDAGLAYVADGINMQSWLRQWPQPSPATVTLPLRNGFANLTSDRQIVELFSRYAVLDAGSTRKRLTDAVYELDEVRPPHCCAASLPPMERLPTWRRRRSTFRSISSSLALLKQVQHLLLSFGVKSKLDSTDATSS